MVEAKAGTRRIVRRTYSVSKSRRPVLLEVDDRGRHKFTFLPMPELSEILERLPDEEMRRLFVQTYAQGLSRGYREGLDQRDELLGELAGTGVSLRLLRTCVAKLPAQWAIAGRCIGCRRWNGVATREAWEGLLERPCPDRGRLKW